MDIDLLIYPDLCDSFGHLNQASYLTLFERARWEALARGPGMDFFQKAGVWPAVRKAGIDYLAQAFPGDTLRFHHTLTHLGRTSLTLRQAARRVSDDQLIATAEFTFVCLGTAMRRGELLALRWRDVHLLEGRLRVRESLVNGRFIVTPPRDRAETSL